jgi:Ca-activated chloride channel family protein
MFLRKIFGLGLAVFTLLTFSGLLTAQDKEDEIIKVETSLVNIPVIVSDRDGRHIGGLKAANFSVFEDGKPQKIEYFVSEESPINVAILLDTSRSTRAVLEEIKEAARDFLGQLRPSDKAMIVSFDNDVEILSELTSDRRMLEDGIWNAEIGERAGTVLRDALYEVVNQRFAAVKGRKAMILLTDGKDAGSYTEEEELMRQIDESDTLIYSIFYETGNLRGGRMRDRNPDIFSGRNRRGGMRRQNRFPDDFPPPNVERRRQRVEMANERAVDFLQSISDSTAGRLYQENISDLGQVFTSIADELRKQYLIGYYPERDGNQAEVHQIRVRTDRPNAVVRAKTTYRSQTTQ